MDGVDKHKKLGVIKQLNQLSFCNRLLLVQSRLFLLFDFTIFGWINKVVMDERQIWRQNQC